MTVHADSATGRSLRPAADACAQLVVGGGLLPAGLSLKPGGTSGRVPG